jgi:KUP system potassium uptake protein
MRLNTTGLSFTAKDASELARSVIPGLELDPSQLSFFVGRTNVKSSPQPRMARWRERLYSGLVRVATRPTEFFRIPPDRVIKLGAEVEI